MMSIKWIGAFLIFAGCSAVGFSAAAAFKKEEQALRQMVSALDYMECELQYRLTPLPDLCRLASGQNKNCISRMLACLAAELEAQISPDVESCVNAALITCGELPKRITQAFRIMGTSLGRFDVEGQIRGLEAVRAFCRRELEAMAANRENRLRSYQTLGLCAGAALAIIFI